MDSLLPSSMTLVYRMILFALLFAYTCHASFMIYHWFAYGSNNLLSRRATFAYLLVSLMAFTVLAIIAFV